MKIALDYDETYTEDKQLFYNFVIAARSLGHEVKFVTYRGEEGSFINGVMHSNDDILADAKVLGIDIIFTEGEQKANFYDADVWIDDCPVCIPTNDQLKSMTEYGDIR